jgi:hypothetical protein
MPELPPILIASRASWASSGVAQKPIECDTCKFSPASFGFVPDHYGDEAKLAIMLPYPDKEDANTQDSLASGMGKYILHKYLHPLGFTKKTLLVSYVLRCCPRWNKRLRKPGYPTGKTRDNAEVSCRIYDNRHGHEGSLVSGGLWAFNPNIFLITFNPRDSIKIPAYHRQLRIDFEKAREFVKRGYRPLVLCGNEASEMIFPFIQGKGSAKAWRGTFAEMDYKFSNINNEGTFIPV